jgi:Ser/Thr protein kinase RdoA (MazF antagonist)
MEHGSTSTARLLERNGQRFVAKTVSLTEASAAWEAALLEFLHGHGLLAPLLVPAMRGHLTSGGLILVTYIDGRPPATAAEWQAVGVYLQRVHALTHNWPKRPDMPSVIELLRGDGGIRQGMDEQTRSLLRRAWSGIAGSPASVIHGDANEHNVMMTTDGAALIDWEESRVDYSALDDAGLPGGESIEDAFPASLAWEAFLFWESEPAYARRCLSRLRAVMA